MTLAWLTYENLVLTNVQPGWARKSTPKGTSGPVNGKAGVSGERFLSRLPSRG